MLIAGGDGTSGHYQTDVWSSQNGADWFRETDAPALQQRLLFNSFNHLDLVCFFGGQTIPEIIPDDAVEHADLWCRRQDGSWEWITEEAEPLQRSGILGQAVLNDEVWILGGGRYQFPVTDDARRNDVWKSTDLKQWTRVLEHAPWSGRIYHNVAVFDGRLWVMAGYDRDNLGDCWYSKDGYNWYALQTPWPARHAASLFVHRDALWLAAGSDSQPRNDVWRLRRVSP
jgi:hypothetical protein